MYAFQRVGYFLADCIHTCTHIQATRNEKVMVLGSRGASVDPHRKSKRKALGIHPDKLNDIHASTIYNTVSRFIRAIFGTSMNAPFSLDDLGHTDIA